MDSLLYTLSETVHKQNYAVATYHISLPKEVDVLKKAAALAVGQTIGTWIPIPGITEEIREKYMGKVGFNSYDFMSMVGEIEEKFDVEVEEREVVNVKTVKDAVAYIQSLQAE